METSIMVAVFNLNLNKTTSLLRLQTIVQSHYMTELEQQCKKQEGLAVITSKTIQFL